MEIRTRESPKMQAGEEAGNNRLRALEGAFKPEKIVQKGEAAGKKGKNAMTEAASQEENAEDAGEYAADKAAESAKGTAAKAAARTKQQVKKTLDDVRKELKERRKARYEHERMQSGEGNRTSWRYRGPQSEGGRAETSRLSGNGSGTGRNAAEYQNGSSDAHSGNYRFSAKDMNSLGTEGGNPGTGGALEGKGGSGYSFKAKPDAGIKVREQSVKNADRRVRTTAQNAAKTSKKAAKRAADTARKAAQKAAKEAAKTAAKTTEKAAKATAKTVKEVAEALFKAVSALIEKLGAACAAGGPFVFIIIAAAVYISVIMYQMYGIVDKLLSIFSRGGAIVWEGDVENLEEMIKDAHLEPNPAILALNERHHERLDRIIRNNKHDGVVLENPDPDWDDILGFWAVWQLCENGGEFPDMADGSMEGLNKVFNDMVTVEFEVAVGGAHESDEGEENEGDSEPDEESGESILTITVEQLSIEDMAELYELGEDGDDYIELMTEGSLFEVINILTGYIEGYELPEEGDEEESKGAGCPGGGGSF